MNAEELSQQLRRRLVERGTCETQSGELTRPSINKSGLDLNAFVWRSAQIHFTLHLSALIYHHGIGPSVFNNKFGIFMMKAKEAQALSIIVHSLPGC